MERALQVPKAVALLSAAFMCIAVGAAAMHVGYAVPDLNPTVVKLNTAIESLNTTLVEVNRPCPKEGDKAIPCGTLADVNRTLDPVRGAFGQVEAAARHEDKNLTTLDAQELALFGDTHGTLQALNLGVTNLSSQSVVMLRQFGDTAPKLDEGVQEFSKFIKTADVTVGSANTLLADPSIPKITANVVRMTDSGAGILQDAKDEADKLTHPPVKKLTFWGALDATALWVHSHIMPPIF